MMRLALMVSALIAVVGVATTTRAETPEEWITLGARMKAEGLFDVTPVQ
jgi:hypothetical protein